MGCLNWSIVCCFCNDFLWFKLFLKQELTDHQQLSEAKIKELEEKLLDQQTQVINDAESSMQLQLAFLTMAKIRRFWGTVCPR